jgi:dihydrofolate reductase
MSPTVSLIAAVSENNVIGKNGRLPWRLPADLRRFRNLTEGKAVIMGRKTFESIGKPLPGRFNIVVTKQREGIPGCIVAHSLEDALKATEVSSLRSDVSSRKLDVRSQKSDVREVFVIGGGEIYKQALPLAHRFYLTRVHASIEGDVVFPEVAWEEWNEISREHHGTDASHAYPYTFLVYERLS